MKLIIEVDNCLDCPCKETFREQGGSYTLCVHKDLKQSRAWYECQIGTGSNFKEVPEWCPLEK